MACRKTEPVCPGGRPGWPEVPRGPSWDPMGQGKRPYLDADPIPQEGKPCLEADSGSGIDLLTLSLPSTWARAPPPIFHPNLPSAPQGSSSILGFRDISTLPSSSHRLQTPALPQTLCSGFCSFPDLHWAPARSPHGVPPQPGSVCVLLCPLQSLCSPGHGLFVPTLDSGA